MVTDYHDFCYRGSTKEHCEKLGIGSIYLNAASCKSCGYFIRSRNRHDMVFCKCGKSAIDGGSWYVKVLGNPNVITELFEWAKNE